MSGPEVEITCGECRTGFDDEAAICESCFKAKQEAVTKLEQRVIDLNEEIAGLQDLRPRRIAHLSNAEIDALERRRAFAVNELRYQWGREIARESA